MCTAAVWRAVIMHAKGEVRDEEKGLKTGTRKLGRGHMPMSG